MATSASALFHFTSNIDNLLSILTDTFLPKFCLENSPLAVNEELRDEPQYAIPMNCFCDLPLSGASEHLEFYGKYGIGLSKEWGIKNGISPIIYLCLNSSLKNHITTISLPGLIKPAVDNMNKIDDIWNKEDGFWNIQPPSDIIDKSWLNLLELGKFIKPYQGVAFRGDKRPFKVFYDEREWRFAPQFPQDLKYEDLSYYWLSRDQFNDGETRSKSEKFLAQTTRLSFEPKDIKYIIVEKEDEILTMFNQLQEIKGKFDPDTKNVLSTRIISTEAIQSDF